MLTLPDVRQQTDYSCGDAAVESVCRFYGTKKTGALANPIQGLSPDSIEALLRFRGLTVLAGPLTFADLRHLSKDRPVICPVSLAGGHWVVVSGVDSRGRVHYHDPAEGPTYRSRDAWWKVWYDATRTGHNYIQWGICAWLT